jgi:hypothetical protein
MRAVGLAALALMLSAPVALGSVSPATGAQRPSLRIAGPLLLQGRDFQAREAVVVSFRATNFARTMHARTTTKGTFRLRMPPSPQCLGRLLVVARGSAGDVGRLSLATRTCGPAPSPAPPS